jgi:very-short-patch-repair endonuclease
MNKAKAQFYHAQAAKLDVRRKWQNMAIWPIIYRFGERLRCEIEYRHCNHIIDLYIPALNFAIEIDEPYHESRINEDAERQTAITNRLACKFVRIKVENEKSLFLQIEELMSLIQDRINKDNPQVWDLKGIPIRKTVALSGQGYSQANIDELRKSGIPELVEEIKRDLAALQIEVSDELGPIKPSNGELGFSVPIPGIKFCISVRTNRQAKMLVTDYTEPAIKKLGITLDGPKKGSTVYWRIVEFDGRYEIEEITKKIITYSEVLKSENGKGIASR